jgi:hypothetical protein
VLHDGPEPADSTPVPRPAAPAGRPYVEGLLTALGLVMVIGGAALAWRGGTLREAGQAVAHVLPPAQAAAPAADLRASVVEVFRLYGIAAQASWSPEGELVLRTQERDTAKVQAAAAAARRDIARLPALRVDNQPPAPVVAAAAPAPDDPSSTTKTAPTSSPLTAAATSAARCCPAATASCRSPSAASSSNATASARA